MPKRCCTRNNDSLARAPIKEECTSEKAHSLLQSLILSVPSASGTTFGEPTGTPHLTTPVVTEPDCRCRQVLARLSPFPSPVMASFCGCLMWQWTSSGPVGWEGQEIQLGARWLRNSHGRGITGLPFYTEQQIYWNFFSFPSVLVYPGVIAPLSFIQWMFLGEKNFILGYNQILWPLRWLIRNFREGIRFRKSFLFFYM